jgi:hypothetical protein
MSWFNRSPRKNEPEKHHTTPRRASPSSNKMMEEAKAKGPDKTKNNKSKVDK